MQAPSELVAKISSMMGGMGEGPLLVHSDLLRAGLPSSRPRGRQDLLIAHWRTISEISIERSVWMHAFNYDFPHNGIHNVARDSSQVGPFTEYFRTHIAEWRTATPIFSFSGTGHPPPEDSSSEIDPFGVKSVYNHLIETDAVDLSYGASNSSSNIIHYAERQSGGPLYRYDKVFPGKVIFPDGSTKAVKLLYHVRPWEMGLEYDHSRMLADLVDAGVCDVWMPGPLQFIAASARLLVKFWTERLAEDSLYMLDQPTRRWVEPMLDKLGRRFELEDFEGPVITSVAKG